VSPQVVAQQMTNKATNQASSEPVGTSARRLVQGIILRCSIGGARLCGAPRQTTTSAQKTGAKTQRPKESPMLNVFTLANGRLFQEEIDSLEALAHVTPVWVDLEAPSEDEKQWVEKRFGLSIPKDAVDDDIEESARFYEEDNGELHIRSDFLIDASDGPKGPGSPGSETARNVRVAFILRDKVLFSIHAEDLPVFRLLRLRARRIPALIEDAKDVLLKLYDADAEYSADALEGIYDGLEKVSAKVLTQDVNDQVAGAALTAIAREEDLNGRIRRNVMDTRRALSFMMRSRMLNAEQFEEARQILRDIDSLDSHTAFLFDKINFLMDATVGFVNINQNKIIKIFSVASVALLPPTLIASIYGMNFKFMPELDWAAGYPFALGLMAASVAAPFIYFRRKGWLR
jgi:magnesium transporter